jgi:hypothetical protein
MSSKAAWLVATRLHETSTAHTMVFETCDWCEKAAAAIDADPGVRRLVEAAQAVEAHLVTTFPPYPDGGSPFDKLRAALRDWHQE